MALPCRRSGKQGRSAADGESNAADSAGGDEFGGQAWQQYFFLAPNVRFTRTPDSDKRPAPEPVDEAPAKAVASRGLPIRPAPLAPQPTNP
ncbi:hypothetical protein, partial [Mesorhizobium sp.]|uniref:hypothetical protein n=1 Tax=Mesorhizobium sp. TaxID=1871066 RepID=UPI000FE67B79